MIPLVPDVEGYDWRYDDVEVDDLGECVEGIEFEAGARLELTDEGARAETGDDDIGRALEEMELQDEGS